jgi:hypothetical protein
LYVNFNVSSQVKLAADTMLFEYDDLVINLKSVDGMPLQTNLKVEYAGDLTLHPLSQREGQGYLMRYLLPLEETKEGIFSLSPMQYLWILEEELKGRFFKVSEITPELMTAIMRDAKIDEILED